ncbi:hypothetical protein EV291_14724 [Rhizobium sp. BK068]|nr:MULTISPECIES: Pycsar system effector family protein [unclassified Rhizobium]TCM63878.1 hypothetical protein EV291_14724 [Rhizobium sp. BK068]
MARGCGVSDFENSSDYLFSVPSTEDVGSEYLDHIKKINDIFYDQIKLSDQKAAYIFTFMLAFLVTSSEGREVFTWGRYAQGSPQGILLSGALALASIVSILSAILVVLPRHVNSSTSLFWGAWPKHRGHFREAATKRDKGYLFEQYVENADILSTIARGKYRCVSYAFRALMVTVIAYILLLVST